MRLLRFALLLALGCLTPTALAQSATTTTLAITSGGSPVTTIRQGTAVTLTATVLTGSTPVTPGQVNFCEIKTQPLQCTDIRLLGTTQLTSAGTAIFKFFPGAGTHTYQAVFLGTHNAGTSSSISSPLVVTPFYPTTTTITSSGSQGNYTLSATVTGTEGTIPPTGTISFLDTTNANYLLATAPLVGDPAPPGFSFVSIPNAAPAFIPLSLAIADFNGDGKLDLAAMGDGNERFAVSLGKGDGTFTPAPNSSLPANIVNLGNATTGDFNGDGKVDIALISEIPSTGTADQNEINILIGNGDGTFTLGQQIQTVNPVFITTGDFNGDGIADLAVSVGGGTVRANGTIAILLGNGDGTFTPTSTAPTQIVPSGLVTGDFNGDGKLDLAVVNEESATVTILLGNGDGTLTPTSQALATGVVPISIIAADFNGDGKLDLAVANSGIETTSPDLPGSVTIFLGNGDGTFTPSAATSTVGKIADSIAVGDFNGDGKPDLVTTSDLNLGSVYVLLGNGDGTFAPALKLPSGTGSNLNVPDVVAARDFNGDGLSDIAVAANQNTSVYLLLSQAGPQSATATVSGISPVGTGTHLVDASFPGDSDYQPSISATIPLTAQPVPTTLTLTASPANSVFGQQVTLTAALTPNTAQNHAATGTVTFNVGTTIVGTAPIANGIVTFNTTLLPTGTDTVTATYSGDTNFAPTTSTTSVVVKVAPPDFTIALSNPTITLATYQHTTTTVTLTSIGAFSDSIAIACVNPPTYVSCIFTPQSATLTASGTTTVSFYLDTDSVIGGVNGPLHASRTQPPSAINFAWLLSPFSLFAALSFCRRNKSRRAPLLLLAILALPITLALTSCGGNIITPIPSAAPGTYTLTIAASGATTGITHTAQLTLTVTP